MANSLPLKRTYKPEVPEDQPEHYRPGGFHPTLLGDIFQGRYKVLHKLGFGSFGMIWAARDLRNEKYVALKITVADPKSDREVEIMKKLSTLQPDSPHIVSMLNHFKHTGPNGTHNCLVLEMLSEDIPNHIEGGACCQKNRETDLHARNLCFSLPSLHHLSEEKFSQRLQKLYEKEKFAVVREDGKPLENNVPDIVVCPMWLPIDLSAPLDVKIIDFGQAFTPSSKPDTLRTPEYLQPPEIVFKDEFDYRVDLWGMGCMLFELFFGRPPFDAWPFHPHDYIKEICYCVGEDLPQRWLATWKEGHGATPKLGKKPSEPTTSISDDSSETSDDETLEGLIAYLYDNLSSVPKEEEGKLSGEDLKKVAELIKKLLRLEPSERAEVAELLSDEWWDE